VAEVTPANEVKTALTRVPGSAGYVALVAEHDSGYATGIVYQDLLDITSDSQLRVGSTTLLDNEVFNYAAQNTAKHKFLNTTMAAAWGGGFLVTNSGAITTINTGLLVSTYNKFPVFGKSDLSVESTCAFATAWLATNTTIDFGVFLAGASTPYAPTDGVYFRANSTGLCGVANYNGTEQTSGVFKAVAGGADWTPTLGNVYKFKIAVATREVEFWIDGVLMAELAVPNGTGQPVSCGSMPWSIRHGIGGTAASAAQQLKVATMAASMSDLNTAKPWAFQCCEMGQTGHQGQSGGTMGSTDALANSTNPTPGAGSNTTANITGLGGVGAINAAASAATDFIASDYTVPDSTTAFTGRKLVVTGVRISAFNNGASASAATPTVLLWSLAFGHTATSLVTGETSGSKAPRRVALGHMYLPISSVIGVGFDKDITVAFTSPIVVNPGEHIATVMRQVSGAATASEAYWYSVMFDAHFA
jgi:hypothetical protein